MINSYKDLKIGFIGAGKVGFSLGKLFSENGIHVTGYYSRHIESAIEAADFTGSRSFKDLESIVDCSNALFLTVSDSEIAKVFQSIKDLNISKKLICHTSGALSSKEAFEGIDEVGAYGYSVHPLFPVSSKTNSYKELADAFFCLEGNEKYLNIIIDMLTSINIKVREISADCKTEYHAACTFASNLVCGLIRQSQSMLMNCGFDEDDSIKALAPLIQSNIKHIIEDGPVKALTGPVERADNSTIIKHINCLHSKEEINMYKSVSMKVLDLAKEKNKGRDYSNIENTLKE